MFRKLAIVSVDAIYGHGSVGDMFMVVQISCIWMLLQYGCRPYK